MIAALEVVVALLGLEMRSLHAKAADARAVAEDVLAVALDVEQRARAARGVQARSQAERVASHRTLMRIAGPRSRDASAGVTPGWRQLARQGDALTDVDVLVVREIHVDVVRQQHGASRALFTVAISSKSGQSDPRALESAGASSRRCCP